MSDASRLNLPVYFCTTALFNQSDVVLALKFEPETGSIAEIAAKPHRRLGSDRTAAVQDVRNTAGRNAKSQGQSIGAQASRFQLALQQPTRMGNRRHRFILCGNRLFPRETRHPAAPGFPPVISTPIRRHISHLWPYQREITRHPAKASTTCLSRCSNAPAILPWPCLQGTNRHSAIPDHSAVFVTRG